MSEVQGILAAIAAGTFDEDLSLIDRAVVARQRSKRSSDATQMAAVLRPHDMVTLHGLAPKRINGSVVEVVKVNRSRAVILMDGRRVTAPLSCMTLVES